MLRSDPKLRVFAMDTGGKYAPEYADKLRRAAERHLHREHEFWLITDRDRTEFEIFGEPGVHILRDHSDLEGWWRKLEILGYLGDCLWLDLDVVIVGDLDHFCDTESTIRTAKNWAMSGHGGCQSSVMFWRDAGEVFEAFEDARASTPERFPWPPRNEPGVLWGDQEFLTELRDRGALAVDYFPEDCVRSYKYHCRSGLPEAASVIVFHGKPDPHEVSDDWVQENWQ